MKSATKFPWLLPVVGVAVAALVTVLFILSQGASPTANRKILTATDRYARFSAELEVEIIRLRHRYLNDYDALVDDLNRIDLQLAKLRQLLAAYQDPVISKLLQEIETDTQVRKQQIERFKGVNSILRNSTFYLPKTIELLRTHPAASQETITLASKLLEATLVLEQDSSEAQQTIVRALAARLSEQGARTPALREAIETAKHHVENILTYQAESDKLVDQLTVGHRKFGDDLRQAYLKVRSTEESHAKTYRLLLSLLSLLLILYAVRSYLVLRERSYELQSALQDLQNQKFALDQHAIVSATNVRGDIIYANDKFCEISKYTREEMLGQNHRMLKSDEHSEEFFRSMWKTIAQGKVWHGQVRNRARDGSSYWVDATVVPFIDEDGKPYQYISIRTDITALKRLQAKTLEDRRFLETVMETLGEGVFALDSRDQCTYINSEALNLLGYARDELLGTMWPALPVSAESQNLQADMLSCLRSGHVYHSDRDTMSRSDGSPIPVEIIARPILENGNYLGAVCAFRDVGERLRQERELVESRENAERANLSKSQFLATMSHEIRTPLNGVIGMLDLVLDSDLDFQRRDMLSVARQSADHLLSILNEILDFSKIESGMLTLESVPFSLREQIENTLRPLVVLAEQRDLYLKWEIAAELPDHYLGDTLRLRQILFNLVSNAIKFTHQGGIDIAIGKDCGEEKHVVIAFAVQDSGIGIAHDKLSHIFEPFSQADASTTRNYGGTGLGLSICKRLSEIMGGGITAISTPGQGSTFRFTVRLAVAETPYMAHGTANAASALRETGKKHLLLVEDNPVNQRIAKHVLEKFHYTVGLAENGQEGVEQWRTGAYDLVLMDMQMPVMDGLEAASSIRAEEKARGLPPTPILAMTANAYDEDRQRCLDAGMNGFVSKPINQEALRAELVRLLEQDNKPRAAHPK